MFPPQDVDDIREERYLLERTYVRNPRRRRSAHRTAAGDLGLPGRLRRPARLPADCAGDWRCGRVGEIAAGGPLLAEDNIEEHLVLPEMLQRGGADFLLRVKGDSMIEAGILDGDIVVVRREQTAENGDIVVALAGDDETVEDATVKRFFREDGRVRLQPENSELEPIYAAHVQVIGKVIGVFRAL